jgi:hypothetical protein
MVPLPVPVLEGVSLESTMINGESSYGAFQVDTGVEGAHRFAFAYLTTNL